ncbi:MAG: hypothetical protein ACOYZ6_02630 [Chloroflexota bacterium]
MQTLPSLTQPATYRVRINGRVRNGWSDFLSDLQVKFLQTNGFPVTELTGTVRDQSALFGLLCRIRDLGVSLVSVEYIQSSKGE